MLADILGGGAGLSDALSSSDRRDRERARVPSDIGYEFVGKRC